VVARDILDRALSAAETDDCYQALKLARRIIRHEDAILARCQTVVTPPQNATSIRRDRLQPCPA
jgi:flagellar protein FlbT